MSLPILVNVFAIFAQRLNFRSFLNSNARPIQDITFISGIKNNDQKQSQHNASIEFVISWPKLSFMKEIESITERFCRYVKIDTQSDPHSPSCPSTAKQKNLSALLVKELHEMGISNAEMDENGYVYATIPSNTTKIVPTICFCSHVDTSPESSGKDVAPVIHNNYDGKPIRLPKNDKIIIDPKDHPDLLAQIGNDIITADGTTLLGADNKAGVAEIMEMAMYFCNNEDKKHGPIKILFTPDEEIGRGVDKVNLEKLGADFAYTVDGESLGSMEDETFSADGAVLEIYGVNTHPGFAKGKLENALKIASDFISLLPKSGLSPETTDEREGFIHPYEIKGGVEKVTITFILRSFDEKELKLQSEIINQLMNQVIAPFPGSSFQLTINEQYRNMKIILDQHPEVVAYAEEAIIRSGLELKKGSIRGGTDGSRLSFMGLPCPNIFAGEHAFHSKYEWVSVYDMKKAVETLINLACIWEEKS
jgi:tripeptide aminopeptidase